MATYGIKAVKTFRGHDGTGVEGSITKDGQVIGTFFDDARGGEMEFDFVGGWKGQAWLDFVAWVRLLPDAPSADDSTAPGIRMDPAIWVDAQVDAWEQAKFAKGLKRKMLTATLFVAAGERPEEGYRCVKAPYSPAVKSFIQRKYPGARILNEEA